MPLFKLKSRHLLLIEGYQTTWSAWRALVPGVGHEGEERARALKFSLHVGRGEAPVRKNRSGMPECGRSSLGGGAPGSGVRQVCWLPFARGGAAAGKGEMMCHS